MKTAPTQERIGRLRQGRQDSIVIKQKKLADPDDVLTPDEGKLLKKAEREIKQGKYVTLAQLQDDLARKGSRRSRKTA